MRILYLSVLAVILSSCGGGGGSGTSTPNPNSSSSSLVSSNLNGVAMDGYLYNAEVFIDLDGDICEGAMGAIIGRDKNGKAIYATPEKVLKLGLIREKGFLYYVGKDSNIYRSKKTEE